MGDTPSHTSIRRRVTALTTTVALGAGLVAGGAVSPASAATPAPDLHYSMDAITGTTVPDSSGNGRNGTISGSTAIIDADTGNALDLTGGHVVLPREVLAGATDLTVATRVRWDGGAAWQWLFGLGSNTTRYLFTSPSSGDGLLRTAITRAGGGSNEQTVTGSGPLPSGSWVNLAVTLDTTADRLITYIDGAAVSSVATDVTAGELLTDTATSAGFIGRSFYPDPAFNGAIDDFQVFRSALSASQVSELSGVEAPTLESLTTTQFDVRTPVNTAPVLPETVRGTFSDGVLRDVPITWDAVPASAYAQSGVFTVAGRAATFDVTAEVTAHRGEVRVDLGENTGDVYGGASGVLYGLYGQDMPTANLVEGMDVRTVATKAQDGGQHPGSDALEILPTLAASGGDVYLRVTDYYRGFPYQWPGSTPAEKLADYRQVLDEQLEMIQTIPAEQREHLVIEPFNEPEGNMFGTGQWSLNGTSWLNNPTDYFAAWDSTYRRIKEMFPEMRIAGPGLSLLFSQTQGFMAHAVAEDTVPDIITWHELSDPATIRTSVDRFRDWEETAFAGTEYEGTELPININEYAFNYHTSVPGQMIQWIAAIEEKKVDAMIAFWNINGNLSDSAVQQNRGNGQWWLYNAYAQMSGHTVEVTPPSPGQSYTLQGVSSLDEQKQISRTIIGGASGSAPIDLVNVPADVFGSSVRVQVREIPWTGQLGDSKQPIVLSDRIAELNGGALTVDFGSGDLPQLTESSAYEIIVTPGAGAEATAAAPAWRGSYEAEDAAFTGTGYSRNGPEGSPSNVSKFYTSGGFNVGGIREGSTGALSFTVDVPETGAYDLSVFANSLNTYGLIADDGPTNVFMTVDGAAEQEMFLTLGYKWVVWDHSDTTVQLTAGSHTIALATTSSTGTGTTQGDAIIDRITLERSAAAAAVTDYEAEYADHTGTPTATGVTLAADETATLWVYGAKDAEATLEVLGSGSGTVSVNGDDVLDLDDSKEVAVHVQGGINKVVVSGTAALDRIRIAASESQLVSTAYQAEDATLAGDVTTVGLGLAEGGIAVDGIGGAPGNGNTLTFSVQADEAGKHAVVVRFSNPEQVPATHYNPNPMARHADISVNGGASDRVLFVPTFHRNNFWERTLVLDLEQGANTIEFGAEEQPNFDGETYAQDNFPGIPLRSDKAPIIDRISVSALSAVIEAPVVVTPEVTSADGANAAGWHRSAVSVTFTDDAANAEVQYRLDGAGEWAEATDPLVISTDGTSTVNYRAVRGGTAVAGSEGSFEVKLDSTAPMTSAATNPESGSVAVGQTVTALFTATDGTSGLERTEYSTDTGATWVAGSEVSFTEIGSYAVLYRSVDAAGNVEAAKSITVTVTALDNTAKVTITSANEPSADGWYRQNVLVKLEAAQVGQKVQYRINGGAWKNFSSSLTVSANGTTKIDHRLLSSNVVVVGSEAQTVVKIDKQVPIVAVERTPGTGTPRNPISVTLSGTDLLSGLDRIEYRINSGAWETASAEPLVLSTVGDYVVSYRGFDKAGNTSSTKSVTVVINADVATSIKASVKSAKPGAAITLTLAGFARWDDVTVTFAGQPLTTVLTDQNGKAKVTVMIPDTAATGVAAIVATGTDTSLTATTTVTVK